MHERATPDAMRRRRYTVKKPFPCLKYRTFGHLRLLMRGMAGAAAEMAIATTVWNLKRSMETLRAGTLQRKLATWTQKQTTHPMGVVCLGRHQQVATQASERVHSSSRLRLGATTKQWRLLVN